VRTLASFRELSQIVAAASASICIRGLSWELLAWQGCVMRVGVRSNHFTVGYRDFFPKTQIENSKSLNTHHAHEVHVHGVYT
jgi:hypothetical protein